MRWKAYIGVRVEGTINGIDMLLPLLKLGPNVNWYSPLNQTSTTLNSWKKEKETASALVPSSSSSSQALCFMYAYWIHSARPPRRRHDMAFILACVTSCNRSHFFLSTRTSEALYRPTLTHSLIAFVLLDISLPPPHK